MCKRVFTVPAPASKTSEKGGGRDSPREAQAAPVSRDAPSRSKQKDPSPPKEDDADRGTSDAGDTALAMDTGSLLEEFADQEHQAIPMSLPVSEVDNATCPRCDAAMTADDSRCASCGYEVRQ